MKSFLHPHKFLLALSISALTLTASAQNNVGIGTTTPNPKAILELQAVDKGFLAPRITATQMNAIATPPNGLLVYNTTTNCFYYFNSISNSWKDMCSIGAAGSSGTDTLFLNLVKIDSLFSHLIKSDSVFSHVTITNYLKADSAFIKSLVTNYIKSDSAYIKQLVTNTITTTYLKADSAYLKSLVSNYITIDSIQGGFGRFDSLFIGGQNITDYLNTLISNKDTLVIKYLKTDSVQTLLIKADSAYIQNLLTNTITTQFVLTDSIRASFGRFDSLYIGGKNIMSIFNDSIAAQAWLLKGNNATNTNKLGTLNAQNLHIITNNTERISVMSVTGNVGIGQPVPSAKLDVAGNIQFATDLKPAGLSGTTGDLLISQGAGVAPLWISPATVPASNNAWNILGNTAITPTNFLGTTNNASLRFRTNNTEKMIVDSTGVLGIGTSTPVIVTQGTIPLLLDVRGGQVLQGRLSFMQYGKAPVVGNAIYATDHYNNRFRIIRQPDMFSGGFDALNVDSVGNVGIGTYAKRATKLDVNGKARILGNSNFTLGLDSANDLAMETNITNRRLLFGGNATGYTIQSTELTTGNNVALSLNTLGGNVGIGLANPTALLHINKILSANIAPAGNYFMFHNELNNNATLASTGNITSNFNRIVNGASGTMQAAAASIVGAENGIFNNGTISNTINLFGGYNRVENNGVYTTTGETDGVYALVQNNGGKTMNSPFTRGAVATINNLGTLNGLNAITVGAGFTNSGTANITNEVAAGYFSIDNYTGATLTTPYTRGVVAIVRNNATINSAAMEGIETGLQFFNGATTTLTSEANGIKAYVINNTGATANVPYTKAAHGYVFNGGTYNGNGMYANENYIDNGGLLTLTGGARGSTINVNNRTASTLSAPSTIGIEASINNSGNLTATTDQVTAGLAAITNYTGGTITTPYMRGGYFSVFNQQGATINVAKVAITTGSYFNNQGNFTAKYLYGADISLYNKSTMHTGHQRAINMYMTNDSAGTLIADSTYIAAVIANNNYGNLTTADQRGLLTEVQNLPGSTVTATNMIATESNIAHKGTGTITNAYGLSTNIVRGGSAVITNGYGLYVGAVQATNAFGVYQGDGSAKNFFAGNVGIGTTTPTDKLHVNGKTRLVGNSNFTLPLTTSNDLAIETGITNRRLLFGGNPNGYTIQSTELSSGGSTPLSLNPYGANVGIGTTIPTEKLEVNGSIKITDGTQGAGKVLTSDAAGKASWNTLAPKAVSGNLQSGNVTWTTDNLYHYIGYSVVIPSGRSTVSVGVNMICANMNYFTSRLSSSSTIETFAGISVLPGLCAVTSNPTYNNAVGTMLFYVDNTTGSPITVYVWGIPAGTGNGNTCTILGTATVGEAYILTAY